MQQSVSTNISPWRIFGTRAVPNSVFAFPDQLTDMIDTTTKPTTVVSGTDPTARYVVECDGGGLCLARFWGSDTEDTQFNVRVYTWSRRIGYGYDETPAWTPHYHGEILCTIGTKQVNGTGEIVTSDPNLPLGYETGQTYVDDIAFTNNSKLGSAMRLVGRDGDGAGDGVIAPDNDALILAIDRLNHELIEFQFSTIDAVTMRGECSFASLI